MMGKTHALSGLVVAQFVVPAVAVAPTLAFGLAVLDGTADAVLALLGADYGVAEAARTRLGQRITSIVPAILFVTALVIFSLWPDIDHPGSIISRSLWGPFRNIIGKRIANLAGGHRVGTHSLWACGLLLIGAVPFDPALMAPVVAGAAGVAFWHKGFRPAVFTVATGALGMTLGLLGVRLDTPIALAAFLGALVHILGDMLTVQGVVLLYPFSDRRLHMASLTTGRMGESVIAASLSVASLLLILGVIPALPA